MICLPRLVSGRNLGKVHSNIGSFFRRMENVPFTKRALKTLCGKISSEQADDNVRKTIEVFWAADPEFTYSVQVDDDSESVNPMLKTDSEESFQEKRTRLGGVIYKVGQPMEKHAAKIYTRAMFEKFQNFLYKSGSYFVNQVVPGERYVANKFDSDIREKWCKLQYEVSVSDGYYTCECGMYEHMGMLCCHVLKVLVHLRFTEIPALHVMKRWTVDVQDVLPLHQVQYQKGQGLMTSFSHSQLYLNCMEVVRLGDVNVDAYTTAMESIKVLEPKLVKVAVEGVGLGLEERLSAKKARLEGAAAQIFVQHLPQDDGGGDAISLDAALLAPSKNRSGGRPISSSC
ncbi:hypothetical protein ACQ4PT_031761 [Festuca glaucescens]